MKHYPLLLLLFLCAFKAKAQTPADTGRHYTTDSAIIQDARVNELVMKHILINEAKKEKIKGYRVQIHFGPEKQKALDVKTKYTTQFPTSSAYLDYQQPYFKIRVGDFRTKLEAYKLLQEISADFPGAFIVSDEIELPPL